MLAPLRPAGDDAPPTTGAAEAIAAARDVVNGVRLLERWRTERATLLGALKPPPSSASERDDLAGELDQLASFYDAVCDVMVAEAVHQNMLGNNERAGAVLAALDRQGVPPRMEFVRAPRAPARTIRSACWYCSAASRRRLRGVQCRRIRAALPSRGSTPGSAGSSAIRRGC